MSVYSNTEDDRIFASLLSSAGVNIECVHFNRVFQSLN